MWKFSNVDYEFECLKLKESCANMRIMKIFRKLKIRMFEYFLYFFDGKIFNCLVFVSRDEIF